MKVLGVSDSDSYVKWGAATLGRMPAGWRRDLVVLATPAAPSGDQLAHALAGSGIAADDVPVLPLERLAERVRRDRPDVVLLALRGPVIRVVLRALLAAGGPRPVFVSGLPGISIPATRPALYYRAQTDLFLLHSRREVREFAALSERMGMTQEFGLATLPFVPERGTADATGRDVVFAAQAKVPREKEDRERVLGWLAETARRHPDLRVIIKVRAMAGEQQTHPEKHSYPDLLEHLEHPPANLVVAGGPMSDYLENARALVTISSTAAIEAAATGVPVLCVDDFGVSRKLINTVFVGSGLLGSSERLLAADFPLPDEAWLDDNYFHPDAAQDWADRIARLVAANDAAPIPLREQYKGRMGGRLRRAWDRKRALGHHDRSVSGNLALLVGTPARWGVLAVRKPVRAVRRRLRGEQELERERQLGPVPTADET